MNGGSEACRGRSGAVVVLALALFTLTAPPALAYIGPGVGVGAISAALGVLGAIGLALIAVIYYPIKRLLRRKKKTPGQADGVARKG